MHLKKTILVMALLSAGLLVAQEAPQEAVVSDREARQEELCFFLPYFNWRHGNLTQSRFTQGYVFFFHLPHCLAGI